MDVMPRATLAAAAVLIAVMAGAPRAIGSSEARQELPDGPGKAEVSKLCSGCHDLMFTVSTRETEEG